jgi:hypothetical protein
MTARRITPTPTSAPATQDIRRAAALAADLSEYIYEMEDWLTDEVKPAWDAFLRSVRPIPDYRFSMPYSSSDTHVTFYDLSLTEEGARFCGTGLYCGEAEEHEFTIPWNFIDPATREQASETIRGETERAFAEHVRRTQEARAGLAIAQRTERLARLRAEAADLGVTITDLDGQ